MTTSSMFPLPGELSWLPLFDRDVLSGTKAPQKHLKEELKRRGIPVVSSHGAYKIALIPKDKELQWVLKLPLRMHEASTEAEFSRFRDLYKRGYPYIVRHNWISSRLSVAERLILGNTIIPRAVVNKLMSIGISDLHEGNFGRTKSGEIRLFDLGGHCL